MLTTKKIVKPQGQEPDDFEQTIAQVYFVNVFFSQACHSELADWSIIWLFQNYIFHVFSREKCTKIRILIIGPSGAGNELYRSEVTATRTLHLWSQGIKYYLLDSENPTKFYTEIFSTTFLSFKSWAYSYHGNKVISILGDRCIRQEGHCYLCACATNQSFSKDPGT